MYLGRFRHIQNPGTVRHIHVYYGIFRTHGFFRYIQNHRHIQSVSGTVFRYYSRAIHAYSEPYLGRFRHNQKSGLIRSVMFHTYSAIFTTLHISRNMSRIRAYFSRFRHIEDPCITGQSIACFSSQVLFINHCSDPFGTFFLFCFFFKSKHSTFFFSGQYFNSNSNSM